MECPVCLGAYDSQDYRPLFLPCGHTICASCVSDLASGKTEFMCPNCRKAIPASEAGNLPTNFSLLATSQTSLKSLPEERKAEASSPSSPTCSFHPTKKVKFHCSGCQQTFCSKCVVKHTGAGHKIEDLTQAIDHKLDQMLLEVGSTDAGLVQLNSDFEEFARVNSDLQALQTRLRDLYTQAEARLHAERDEQLAAVTQGIEDNAKALERAREDIRAKTVSFTEAKELLRSARHSLTNPSEKHAAYQRAESLLSSLWNMKISDRAFGVQRPDCELKKYTVTADNVPVRFVQVQPAVVSFLTKDEEEKKEPQGSGEVKRVPGKAEVVTPPPVQKQAGSIPRESIKGKKRDVICWWYMSDNNTWAPYTPAMNRQIEHAYQAGEATVDMGRYQVDFASLTQVNKKTGRARKIGREIS